MKSHFLCVCLLILGILSACQKASPAPTHPSPAAAASLAPTENLGRVFTVYPGQYRQTVAHLGSGNFMHYFGGSLTATEPVSALNIRMLQPKFARVRIELPEWEPKNDNDDPLAMNADKFRDDQHNRAAFQLMQEFQAQGVELIASIWLIPDWMAKDPRVERSRVIPRSLYPEVIESVAAWLLRAQKTYGVEVDYFSFNEANIGINVLLSPEEYAEFIRQGGKRFAELGLKTKFLLGDCSGISGCLDYAKGIYAAEDIHPYLGPLAFHNWDGVNATDATISELGDWALAQGLEIRCTEGGWDAQLWRRSEEFPGWDNARLLATSYSRTLKLSRATTFYYWQMMGNDYALNDGKTPYLAMKILQQMSEAFPSGTRIVETSPNNSAIYLVAGETPSTQGGAAGFVVHWVNNGPKHIVTVNGLPNGSYTLQISDKNGFNQAKQSFEVTNHYTTFELPESSVSLLVKE